MRADTSDVAFRLLLALGDVWDGLLRSNIDPTVRGLHLSKEYFGGYTRYSAGCGAHARLVVELNESSRHLRILRCEEWPGFEATVSGTVAHVRAEARARGVIDRVDPVFIQACQEPAPMRRTVVPTAMASASRPTVARRA